MNPFKGLYEAIRNFIRALGRAADACDSLADDIDKRNDAQEHPAKSGNGVQTPHTSRSKAKA